MALLFQSDTFDVPNPRADRWYTWVPADGLMYGSYINSGYEPTVGDHAIEVLGGKALYEAAKDVLGRVRYNELVLLSVDRKKWDMHQFELARINAQRRQLTERAFLEMCDNMGPGVKAIAMTTIEEMNDQRKFDTREKSDRVSFAGLDAPATMRNASNAAELLAAEAEAEAKRNKEPSIFDVQAVFPPDEAKNTVDSTASTEE